MVPDIFRRDFTPTPYWWEAYMPTAGDLVDVPKAARVAIVGGGYAGLSTALELAKHGIDAVALEAGKLYRCRADHASGDIVLHAEDILNLGIISFGPDVPPRTGLGQLGVDADAIPGTANATAEQVMRIELATDLGRCEVPTLELKARRFGDDEQV